MGRPLSQLIAILGRDNRIKWADCYGTPVDSDLPGMFARGEKILIEQGYGRSGYIWKPVSR